MMWKQDYRSQSKERVNVEKEVIVYYLQDVDLEKKLWEQAKELRIKILDIQEYQEQLRTEMIYTSQIQVSMSETPRSKTNKIKDVDDVIQQTENQLRTYEKELRCSYARVLEQIEECKRVHLAYGTLLPRDREIIKRLYIDNQKWEAVEIDTGINHRILVRDVKEIFRILSEKIDSNLSNIEFAKQKNTYKLIKPIKKKKISTDEVIKGQKDIYEFFTVKKGEKSVKKGQ